MTKTTEEILAAAKSAGVEVTVTQRPKGTGEITALPGVRRPPEFDEYAPERDDDGTGLVE